MSDRDPHFFQRIYEVVRQVPYGRVTSYGAIARYLGTARSARVVGWAMNQSHGMEDVPAHRVVNRNGLLTGKHHFQGTNLMQQLLESEGIQVVDNKIQNFEKNVNDLKPWFRDTPKVKSSLGQKNMLLRDPLNRFVSPKRIRRQNIFLSIFFRSQKNLVSNFHQLFFGKES